jgi:uncharacterized protein DUF3551
MTLAVALALAATLGAAKPAAATDYPWCAQYGGDDGGGTNCGFTTYQQCQATISGIGGSCTPNLFYPGDKSDDQKSQGKPKGEPKRKPKKLMLKN